MKFIYKILIIIAVIGMALISGHAESDNIMLPSRFKISAIPETNTIPLNRKLKVAVEVECEGKAGEYIVSEPYIEKFNNLHLISTAVENLVENSTDNTNHKIIRKRYIYTLKPDTLGLAYFPKAKVAVSDTNGNIVEQLENPAVPITIIDPVYPKNYKPLYIAIIVIISLLIVAVLLLYFMKKYRLKKEAEKKRLEELEKASIPIEEKYLADIEKIFDESETASEFYDKISKLIKKYIGEKFNIKIKGRASSEIVDSLKGIENLDNKVIDNLKAILDEADAVKYARETVDISSKASFRNKVSEFINNSSEKKV